MDDTLILYFKLMIEIASFDEDKHDIFIDHRLAANRSSTDYSDEQLENIIEWACERTSTRTREGLVDLFTKLIVHFKQPEFRLATLDLRQRYSFCGPGTNLRWRLISGNRPRLGSFPINKIDEICLAHDIAYRKVRLGYGTRRRADREMLNNLRAIQTDNLTFHEKHGRFVCILFIGLKYLLHL